MKLHTDNAQKILGLFNKRVQHIIRPLSTQDRQDIQMELESHIYESMQRYPKEDEVTTLLFALEKLGEPENFLTEVVAERKLVQAGKSFNPLHIASAIVLNIGRGVLKTVMFIVAGLLYLLSFAFAILAILKPIFPSKIGYYTNTANGGAFIGWVGSEYLGGTERLGLWFTPIFFTTAVLLYVVITIILKNIPKKRKTTI
jgi:uncharacterized membrane protein